MKQILLMEKTPIALKADSLRVEVAELQAFMIENDITELEQVHACESCGKLITESQDSIYSDVQECWVCETCYYEDEPCLTIVSNDTELDVNGCGTCYVKHYSNDTEGVFQAKWVNSGGWRGYYDVIAVGWKKLHTDCVLAGSEDSAELGEFTEQLEAHFSSHNIRWAKVYSRTSNVFSSGYDFFVKEEDFDSAEKAKKALDLVYSLAEKYRDSDRFAMTALTGSSEVTKESRLLLKAAKMLDKGSDFEEVKEMIMEA